MNDVRNRHASLADKLYEKTLGKSLTWKNDAQASRLSTVIAGFEVSLTDGQTDDNEPIMVVTLRKLTGEYVDSFDDNTLKGISPTIAGFINYWQLLTALEKVAHRDALGADKALEAILSELNEDDVPF